MGYILEAFATVYTGCYACMQNTAPESVNGSKLVLLVLDEHHILAEPTMAVILCCEHQ